jgi:hypothetical protein
MDELEPTDMYEPQKAEPAVFAVKIQPNSSHYCLIESKPKIVCISNGFHSGEMDTSQ